MHKSLDKKDKKLYYVIRQIVKAIKKLNIAYSE